MMAAATAVALAAFVYLYLAFFSFPESQALRSEDIRKKVSEETVRKIDQDITDIERELADPFYAGLKKNTWVPNTAVAGKRNPFVE